MKRIQPAQTAASHDTFTRQLSSATRKLDSNAHLQLRLGRGYILLDNSTCQLIKYVWLGLCYLAEFWASTLCKLKSSRLEILISIWEASLRSGGLTSFVD